MQRRKAILGWLVAAVVLVAVMVGLGAVTAWGQVANGSITGRVTDTTGAALPSTDVTLTRTDTGLVLHATTNGEGIYSFPSLQTGPYVVETAKAGFKTTKESITLSVDQNAQVNLTLPVGTVGETVTVESNTGTQLDTQDSNLAFTVGKSQVSDLPLNGRNPYGLAALSPGIVAGNNFGAGISTARGAVVAAATNNFQSNGGIGGSNEILLDGVSIVVCCQGQPPLTPSVEVVDQFKVITSVPPAQFGRSSGGILNIVTKTGTNGLHGDVYEFLRNEQLDAAPYFTKRSGIYPIPGKHDFRAPHRFNQYGGFVSGPVLIPKLYDGRGKTFFTFGVERIKNVTSTFITTTVPTALQRAGVLTESPNPIYDPYNLTQTGSTYARGLLAAGCNNGTCYPAGFGVANISPVALKQLALIPLPNASGTTNNYSYSKALTDSASQFNFRVDHNFSDKQRTFLRGTRDVNNHHENDLFNQPTGPGGINQALRAYLLALGHTDAVRPSLLLQFNYGFAYQQNHQIPQNFTGFNAADYGFSPAFVGEQQVAGLPYVGISGYTNIANAANFNAFDHYTHTLTAAAILNKGKHTVTAGWEGRLVLENEQGLGNGIGNFTFDSTLTNGPNPSGAVPAGQSQFDSLAAFLIGTPTTTSITRQLTVAFSQKYNAFYVQDDWRVTPKLILNLGARYDIDPGFKERDNRWADFDPNAVNPFGATTGLGFKGGAQYLGVGSNPDRTWKTYFDKVAPRVGFSYNVMPSAVVRGGYGIIYLPTSQRIYGAGTLGFSQTTTISNTATSVPANTFANPFAGGVALPAGSAAGVQAGTGSSVSGELYGQPESYQQQWNFGIEQTLTSKLTFDLNYAGSHGVHLPINSHPNDLLPQEFGAVGDQNQVNYLNAKVANPFAPLVTTGSFTAPTIQRSQLLSAFPQYGLNTGMSNGSLTYNYNDIGSASFNALQAGLQFHGKNLSGATFYTWSKLLGNVSDLINGFLNVTGNPGIQNYYFIKQYERSNLATDIPQRIVGNAIYTLPFGRGQRFGGGVSKWADLAIGGWKLNTIIEVQSGYPLGLTQTGGPAYSGSRPSYTGLAQPLTTGSSHLRLGGGAAVGQSQGYFNPAAFRLSQSFELGNVPRSAGALRSPLSFQDDLSAIKDFEIHEAFKLQFRLEAFNVLNRVQFGLPNTTFGSTSFGVINSQGNLPRNVQGALKLFF
jgi:hypothetical protein